MIRLEAERPTGRAFYKLVGLNALVVFCQVYLVWMLTVTASMVDDRVPDLEFAAVFLLVAALKVAAQNVTVRWKE